MNNNKNTIIYVLGGTVAALLLALVGVLAYNYGKEKSNENTGAKTDTVVVENKANAGDLNSVPSIPREDEMPAPPPEPRVDVRHMSNWHLTGTIAGNRVVMDLSNNDGYLWGSNYYAKNGPSNTLQLSGSIDHNGNVYLDEYNTKEGHISGCLVGRMSSSGSLTGNFTNSRGNTYRVNLKVK